MALYPSLAREVLELCWINTVETRSRVFVYVPGPIVQLVRARRQIACSWYPVKGIWESLQEILPRWRVVLVPAKKNGPLRMECRMDSIQVGSIRIGARKPKDG